MKKVLMSSLWVAMEMSRPTASTRAGFMAQGSGMHIVMSVKTALELGCLVRCILGFTSTSTDKAGRSVPVPGRGLLTVTQEIPSKCLLPILDIAYCSTNSPSDEIEAQKASGETVDKEYYSSRKEVILTLLLCAGALAVWGLTIDGINVLSIHGTSTQANEENKTHFWNLIFKNLGRTPGNIVSIVAQMSLDLAELLQLLLLKLQNIFALERAPFAVHNDPQLFASNSIHLYLVYDTLFALDSTLHRILVAANILTTPFALPQRHRSKKHYNSIKMDLWSTAHDSYDMEFYKPDWLGEVII
ncbi:hypothetical protein BT96DRAFT_1007962 [Gymnopus androsaceus JB14]|uniref:Uncharacterized protein n=1 Tax=Gymnopus androsaceus JB14 TaxID=1447944 RepID=A0A6A4GG57_9AGAR|nr:hypothetical protein BT96DRAFT_1007962 [Gymnopus androsaceus JB14]